MSEESYEFGMPDEQLLAIEARAKQGTPGKFTQDDDMHCGLCVYSEDLDNKVAQFESMSGEYGEADADRFVHSREDVLALVAEVKRLRQAAMDVAIALDELNYREFSKKPE